MASKKVSKAPIIVETEDYQLAVQPEDNLLDALIESGHDIDYQCRSGYCGACRVKATRGQVKYDDLPLAHLNHDEILPCCCRVTEPLQLALKQRQIENSQQGELFQTVDKKKIS